MKTIFSVLISCVMFGLVGCSTVPLYEPSVNLSDAEVAKCVEYQYANKFSATNGDPESQFYLGKKLFIGCTEGRVKNQPEAIVWLEKSARQDNLSANAFLGSNVFGSSALRKKQSGQDWAADEAEAIRYTDKALDIWEKAGRKGFEKFELENLSAAANTRGLMLKRIRGDKEAAAKYYCLAIQITDDVNNVKTLVSNLQVIGKTRAYCK